MKSKAASGRSLITSAAAALAVAGAASAQVTPDRLYNGINRPIPVKVIVPDGAEGEAFIDLYAPGAATPEASAPVVAGTVDLAAQFPALWSAASPALRYAQLRVGAKKIGPPVVLQPLLNPDYATGADRRTGKPSFSSTGPKSSSGLRTYVDKNVVLETTAGEVEFRLRPDQAPNTCFNFRHLVEGGFYTDIVFHRIVPVGPAGPFVIQVGDPTGTGMGGPGYMFDLENSKLPHAFGVLSMARTNDPNTNGSQVFVCLSRPGTEFLDGSYTAFAEAIRGAESIIAIEKSPLEPGSESPADPKPKIVSARLVDAAPFGEGPEPVKRPASATSR